VWIGTVLKEFNIRIRTREVAVAELGRAVGPILRSPLLDVIQWRQDSFIELLEMPERLFAK
jgi:hypothetical protein